MNEEKLPLDRLLGQLAEAIRHKENHSFIKPFLEAGLEKINRKELENSQFLKLDKNSEK